MAQYSMYVDKMNKSSSKVNLVDLKCSKSVLRLLPQRPRSGDARKREERGPMNLERDAKERERPGSLTLRACPPDIRPVDKRGYEQRMGTEKRPDRNYQEKPWRYDSGFRTDDALHRSQSDIALSRSQTDILTASNKTIVSGTNIITSKAKIVGYGQTKPTNRSNINSRNEIYASRQTITKSQSHTSRQSLTRSQSFISRLKLSTAYRPKGPTRTARPSYPQGPNHVPVEKKVPRTKSDRQGPCKVEIIKQSQLDFGYRKVAPGEVLTYEQFLQEQKKRGTRPASCQTSLKSSFNDVPRGEPKGKANKTKTTEKGAENKKSTVTVGVSTTKSRGPAKSKKNTKKMEGKTSSEVSLMKVTSKSNLSKVATTSSSTINTRSSKTSLNKLDDMSAKKSKQLPVKVKKTVSLNSVQNLVQTGVTEAKRSKKKKKGRPSSACSQRSTDSKRGRSLEAKQKAKVQGLKQKPNTGETKMVANDQEMAKETKQFTEIPEVKQPELESRDKADKPDSENAGASEAAGVNVSVFTRDNITVSPRDVVVSRTVNNDSMTILVTVPRTSEALFTSTKIGKVQISLADSPSPDSQSVTSHSSDVNQTTQSGSVTSLGTSDDVAEPITQEFHEPSINTTTDPVQTQPPSPSPKALDTKPRERLHSKLEVVDSGYRSSASPVSLLNQRRKPVSVERPNSRHDDKPASSKSKPKSARYSAKSGTRKASLQSDTKSSKPSPYGNGCIVVDNEVRNVNNRPAARSHSRNAREVTEQSPYGSSYARYRVSQDSRKVEARQPQVSRKKTPRLTAMRRRIEEYSSKICVPTGIVAKGKAPSPNSLPNIYRERRVISRFNGDLAINRNRILVGNAV